MEREEIIESPRKRLKVDNDQSKDNGLVVAEAPSSPNAAPAKESDVGITEFVTADIPGFEGILKKRYTDFLVNEIPSSGEVLHLQNISVPESLASPPAKDLKLSEQNVAEPEGNQPKDGKADAENTITPEFKVSEEDHATLESLFGTETTSKIIDFHAQVLASPKAQPRKFGQIVAGVVDDKDTRTKMHMTLRRIFKSLLESSTNDDNTMIIGAAPNRHKKSSRGFRGESGGRRPDRSTWDERGGSYLHFTIHKENKDTMEIMSFLARNLRMNPKSFKFSGTKDRRGVTVQRACVQKVLAERMVAMNKILRMAVLGDFEYQNYELALGDLQGNEFLITLRDCQFPAGPATTVSQAEEIVSLAMLKLRERGYLNYYGLQRFGTFSTGTHEVGIKMIQGDFKGAVESILQFSPHCLAAAQNQTVVEDGPLVGSDDKARAEAIHIFQTTRNVRAALDKMPKKFSAETSIMRQLGRQSHDYLSALQAIPRNLRLMYVHAYQSLVFNYAASERWRLYGDKVVEGDLVISNQKTAAEEKTEDEATVDADGEVIVVPQPGDSSTAMDDAITRARPISAEEAASGQYTIFDVVLTLPGFDVEYPANQMTEFYKSFMASEQGGGLDPFDMRRKWKDVSLHGGYRKLLNRPGPTYSCQVKAYSSEDEQFVQTDLDRLNAASKAENKEIGNKNNDTSNDDDEKKDALSKESEQPAGEKLAVILKFQLGAGEYATMALRELMKGGLKEYKPEFGGR